LRPNQFLKGRSGIYGIYHPAVGKIYVGKTTDMMRRCSQYRYDFEKQRIGHLNDYLRASMNKYGFDQFVFFPLEFCLESQLEAKEAKWMTVLKSTDRRYGYNLRFDTSGGMVAHSETSEKIRANLRRQWASGVRNGHSELMKAKWASDPDRVRRQTEWFREKRTKFVYVVKPPRGRTITVKYQKLKELGLANVIATMHRSKADDVMFKGYRVIRRLIEDDER
jgi:group I intron endonuclease